MPRRLQDNLLRILKRTHLHKYIGLGGGRLSLIDINKIAWTLLENLQCYIRYQYVSSWTVDVGTWKQWNIVTEHCWPSMNSNAWTTITLSRSTIYPQWCWRQLKSTHHVQHNVYTKQSHAVHEKSCTTACYQLEWSVSRTDLSIMAPPYCASDFTVFNNWFGSSDLLNEQSCSVKK